MIDMTGKPVTKENVEEALVVVRKYMVTGLMSLPPELAVQLLNIHRCLKELLASKGEG